MKKLYNRELKNVVGGVGGGSGSPDLPPRATSNTTEPERKEDPTTKSGG